MNRLAFDEARLKHKHCLCLLSFTHCWQQELVIITAKDSSLRMEYKVVTEGSPNEVWATGIYGDYGKAKAQKRIDEGYFHKHMYESDKSKKLIVMEA